MRKTPTAPQTIGVVHWSNQDYGRRVLSGVLEHYGEAHAVDVLAVPAQQDFRSALCRALDGVIVALNAHGIQRWSCFRLAAKSRHSCSCN